MKETMNVTPMVTHALVKSPTPVDENGMTTVEVEIGVPYGFEPAGWETKPRELDGRVRIFFHFGRKQP